MHKKYLIVAITSPISIVLIKGQLRYFVSLGYQVGLICTPDESVEKFCEEEGAKYLPIKMSREISLLIDLKALVLMWFLVKKEKPDIVNAGTPKASMLVVVCAYLLGIKGRIYTCRGFRYTSEKGIKRSVLKLIERTISKLSNTVLCISPSVRDFGVQEGIFSKSKSRIIHKGSSNGIDLELYRKRGIDFKNKPHIPNKAFVVGFVGRLIERKGINELVKAMMNLFPNYPNLHLLLVGGLDETQLPTEVTCKTIESNSNITSIEWQQEVIPYYELMDLFVLPAYWEGFGNVLIQAAAMGIPIVSTQVTGCKDAVEDGYNGTLVQSKSVNELQTAIENYINSPSLWNKHSGNAKKWADNFDSKIIWNGLDRIYQDLM